MRASPTTMAHAVSAGHESAKLWKREILYLHRFRLKTCRLSNLSKRTMLSGED